MKKPKVAGNWRTPPKMPGFAAAAFDLARRQFRGEKITIRPALGDFRAAVRQEFISLIDRAWNRRR